MNRVIKAGLIAGVVLLVLSVAGLYGTIWVFPKLAVQYYDPTFETPSGRYLLYYVHPFVIAMALSWFWQRFKGVLKGSFLTRGIEFGLIYGLIALLPMMLLIYSAIDVSLAMVSTWFVFGLLQGVVGGLVLEKINP